MEQTWNFLLLLLFIVCKEDSVHCQHRFGYAQKYQRLWSRQHPSCAGSLQSPIHIAGHKAISLSLPALEMVGFHDPLPQPVLTNNGHSVSLSLEKTSEETIPKIFGAVLNGQYEMESFHFHWGSKNSQGSEHVLNGIQYPAEMHIIFRSVKYSSVQEAQLHSDGLTVLAFFIQLREKNNEAVSPLLDSLLAVKHEGRSVHVKSPVILASILPQDMEVYYTYQGSLTTPPCSQAVIWIIFPECIPVSFKQLKRFRHLTAGNSTLVDNYRRAQPLGPRRVFVRRAWWMEGSYNHTQHIDWLVE